LKPLAEANGYNADITEISYVILHDFAYKWKYVPDEFKNLPEFSEISKIAQVLGANRYNVISKISK